MLAQWPPEGWHRSQEHLKRKDAAEVTACSCLQGFLGTQRSCPMMTLCVTVVGHSTGLGL